MKVKSLQQNKMYKVNFVWPQREQTVKIAGDFNNWIPQDLYCQDNIWQLQTSLNQGEYRYKYIVNGNWQIDCNSGSDMVLGHLNNVIQVHPSSPMRQFRK